MFKLTQMQLILYDEMSICVAIRKNNLNAKLEQLELLYF